MYNYIAENLQDTYKMCVANAYKYELINARRVSFFTRLKYIRKGLSKAECLAIEKQVGEIFPLA